MVYENIGIDIIEIDRIAKLQDNTRFLERVFTSAEIAHCFRKAYPAQSLAARFAAKEAVGKALGCGIGIGKLTWKDVETKIVERNPKIFLHGISEESLKNPQIFLSLSHTKLNAAAMVLLRVDFEHFERFQKL